MVYSFLLVLGVKLFYKFLLVISAKADQPKAEVILQKWSKQEVVE